MDGGDKLKKRNLLLFLTAILFWILLIFYFSSQPGSESHLQSDTALAIVRGLNEILDITDNELFIKAELFFRESILNGRYSSADDLVRKSAHFGIYFVLGIFSASFGYFYAGKYLIGLILGVTLPVTVAVLDEYNQGFVGRTSSLEDVMLDGIGAGFGTLTILIIIVCLNGLMSIFRGKGGFDEKKSNK